MLEIEFEEPNYSGPCECCGGATTSLTRYVYQDGDAYAVYKARFSNNHPDRFVIVTVSLGGWGEEANPDQRVAFSVRIWMDESRYCVGLVDAAQSPWRLAKVIGRALDRAEALQHPWLPEVFHITDHIVNEDQVIKQCLTGKEASHKK